MASLMGLSYHSNHAAVQNNDTSIMSPSPTNAVNYPMPLSMAHPMNLPMPLPVSPGSPSNVHMSVGMHPNSHQPLAPTTHIYPMYYHPYQQQQQQQHMQHLQLHFQLQQQQHSHHPLTPSPSPSPTSPSNRLLPPHHLPSKPTVGHICNANLMSPVPLPAAASQILPATATHRMMLPQSKSMDGVLFSEGSLPSQQRLHWNMIYQQQQQHQQQQQQQQHIPRPTSPAIQQASSPCQTSVGTKLTVPNVPASYTKVNPSNINGGLVASQYYGEALRPLSLNDFELFNTLGTGTFGRVYLCRLRQNPNAFFALKMMNKMDILKLKQLDHVFSEKYILSRVNFPFIVRLYATFQNQKNVYMLLEYAMGGELFSYLRKLGQFSLEATRFYASEILLALSYLHERNIIYRDLKPENLLLDEKGHIKITDFGFAKIISDRTWTLCGTPEYLAPEIIQGKGHGKEVDWWALGVLIYEMLIGYPPFYDTNPFGIYEKILAGNLKFPDFVDGCSRDLISRLLMIDRTKRLGSSMRVNETDLDSLEASAASFKGVMEVKSHPWFKDVNWTALLNRTAQTPFVPRYMFPGDTGNFDKYPELQDEAAAQGSESEIDPNIQQFFVHF